MGYGGPHAAYMAVKDALQARAAGPAGRRVGRRARPAGLPARAADARAAHSPREGDLQHLHRAGAAGGHRLDVRGLSWARGADRDRARDRPQDRGAGGRLAAAGIRAARCELLRHRHGRGRRRGRPRSSRAPQAERHQSADHRGGRGRCRRRRSASRSTRPPPPPPSRRSGAPSAATSPSPMSPARLVGLPAAGPRAPHAVPRRTRCSTAIGRRPSCCATCAGCPIATWRSTAA